MYLESRNDKTVKSMEIKWFFLVGEGSFLIKKNKTLRMQSRLPAWGNGWTYSWRPGTLEEAYIHEEKSRTFRISHKDEIEEVTKETEKEPPRRQELKQKNILSQLPGKRVFEERGFYVGAHIGSEGYKTFACWGANRRWASRVNEYRCPFSLWVVCNKQEAPTTGL